MKRTLLLLLFLFPFFIVSAQCAYPGNSAVGTYTFCIDNSNTIATTNVSAGQYVLLNVVSGFNYTFSVGNINSTENENLTLFDSSNTFITGGYNSGTSAATITWTATLSGQIKILFSRGSCVNSGGSSGAITLKLNSVGNNLDSQTTFGTDQWVGHVYNWAGGAPPGGGTSSTSPSTTTSPFTDANYVGYYNVTTEAINEDFGGSYNCFSVLSNGNNRTNIYTQLFAVRYRMKSTKSGCYFLNVSGDDGVRVYVDNVLVFDKWKEQGVTYYCNNLIYLNGNSNIVLDYYENSGANVVGLSLIPFDGSTNVISSSADVKVCSGVSPGSINASSFSSCTGGSNGGTNTTYQWQVSTDNVNFTDISGATSEDYTPGTVTTSTSTVIKYYRRVLIPFASNASSCSFNSSSVKVTTNPSTKTFSTAPTSTSCSSTDITYTTQSGMTNYAWIVPGTLGTDYSITSGSTGSTSNTVTLKWLTSGSKTVTVNYTSSCSGTTAATNTTTVGLAPNNVGNGFFATTICAGDTAKLTFDAEDATFTSPYSITYRNNTTLTQYTITIPSAAAFSFTLADNPTVNTNYTLLSISNATCMRTTGFGAENASLIVRALPTASISGTASVCQGSTSPNITFTNPQTAAIIVTYNVNGGTSATVEVAASSSSTVAAPTTTPGTYTYNLTKVEYKSLSSCSTLLTANATITVSSTASPTGSSSQSFCSLNSPTIASLVATGTGIKWYNSASGGSVYTTTTSLTNGQHYYASQTISGCEGTSRLDVTAVVNPNASVGSVTGASTMCIGDTSTFIVGAVVLSGGTGAWSSSVPSVATVDATGVVTAVGAGYTQIKYIVTGGCGGAKQAAQAINVSAASVGGTVGGGTTICSGQNSGTLLLTGWTGSIIKWQKSVSPFTTWNDFANTNTSYNGIGLTQTTQYRAVVQNGNCNVAYSNFTTVTVQAIPAPTIGTITNIDCVNSTGSVILNGLPTTGSWTVNPGAITGSGSSVTITGLTAGSYAYTVTSAAGCVSPATTTGGIVITNNAAITWDGTAWSNGTGPTSSSNIIFNGNYASSTDLVGCSCQVNTGKTVVFNSGNTLKVTNQVVVTGTGTLAFENKASLVQVNDEAVNSGNIIYKRITSAVSNFDYTYWSSPVKNQKLIDVSPTTLGDKFLSFDSSSNNWKYEDAYNTTMVAGKGYIIRGPQENYAPAPPSSYEASFKGEPINGVVSVVIGGTRVSNLIGNPYPSAISADAFLTANNSVLSGTLYFWTHNTSIQLASNITNGTAGSGSYAYTSDDYASYNLTGGTGTRAALSSGPNASVPDGQIAAGQGFFGTSITPGTATFNNAMRLNGGAIIDNSNFFKPVSTSKTADVVEKNRLWLNLMNDKGAFKQTLVGYITGATNEYESAYDGSSFNANAYVNFYSLLSTSAMAIQGRALPFNENDIVPLGYKSTIVGDFKIAIDQVDGLFTSQEVYLEDKLLNVIHNLKETPYAFTTEIGVFNERFAIRYANKTLGIDDFDTVNNTVFVASKNKEITITTSIELIDKVYVYDFSGRQLYSKTAIDSNLLVVNSLTNANVALIIKVVLNNGELITRKIAY